MSRPELLLSNQLCFLIHRLDLALGARYRPLLSALGLTYTQYLVMLALWEKDGQTVGELCSRISMDTGTISPLLKRLVASGFVIKSRGVEDERSVTVQLTTTGRNLEERAAEVPQALASCIFRDEKEYSELKGQLEKFLTRVGESGC